MSKVLHIENLTAGYDEDIILKGVNLTLAHGDFIGMIGPNGSGKTTLIKVIMGLLKPQSGTITFYNRDGLKTTQLNIGYLAQKSVHDRKFPIRVNEVILSGLMTIGSMGIPSKKLAKERVETVADRLGIISLLKRPFGNLSGGQAQKVLLARAIVSNPPVLLLDEPDTYLDAKTQTDFYTLLGDLNKEMTIILVSHDLNVITPLVKSILCVNRHVHYHPGNEITEELLNVYNCPVELLTHGAVPHRVIKTHKH